MLTTGELIVSKGRQFVSARWPQNVCQTLFATINIIISSSSQTLEIELLFAEIKASACLLEEKVEQNAIK